MDDDTTQVKDIELVRRTSETVIGTPSGLKAQHAQAELMRRLIVSVDRLNASTSYYSKVLIWLTLILGILAVIQIILFFKG